MWAELCCCSIVVFIVVIVLLRLFARTIIINPRQQPSNPPQYYQQPAPDNARPTDIIMVKCQFCGRVYDESLSECPGCGGK